MPRAGAAEFLGNGDAEEAHVGEAFPERTVIARAAVEHRAYYFRRAFLGEIFPRGIAKLFLVVGEIEIHGRSLSTG